MLDSNLKLLESRFAQQGGDDLFPLRIEWRSTARLMSAVVPVGGVRRIAFLAVEISVDPGGIGCLDRLRDLVRLAPAAFGVPPECGQERWQCCGWRGMLQRFAELVEGHVEVGQWLKIALLLVLQVRWQAAVGIQVKPSVVDGRLDGTADDPHIERWRYHHFRISRLLCLMPRDFVGVLYRERCCYTGIEVPRL